MAITATIALSSATVLQEQQVTATVSVANSGGGAVGVLAIQPMVIQTGSSAALDSSSVAIGDVFLSAGAITQVPASGSLNFPVQLVFHAPSITAALPSGTYDVKATVYAADGSVATTSAATITVNPLVAGESI